MPAYNVPTLLRVGVRLDEQLLRRAGRLVLARHEILRTRIRLVDGEPMGEVAEAGELDLTVVDVQDLPAPVRMAEAGRRLGELASRPFDLGSDTLLRIGLAHLVEADLRLVVLHHIASDHASSGLLFRELDLAYRAFRDGVEPELPELPIQYADYAEFQRERLTEAHLDKSLDYWTGRLKGAPERLELPTDKPRPTALSHRGSRLGFAIDPAQAEAIRGLARRHRATPFTALLAAFDVLLHRYSGTEDLVVGVPVSGRRQPEGANLLGYFSNTLALRADLTGDPSFAELLERVRISTVQAQQFAELPFEKLVEVLNPPRSQASSPVFQVLFAFDVAPREAPSLAGCELEFLEVPGWAWSRFDLALVVRETPDGALRCVVEWATDLFQTSTIERLIGHYRELLNAAAGEPGLRISELGLLSPPERERILVTWNQTRRTYDRRAVHELFAEQAQRSGTAIAVVAGDQRLSYCALDDRSNQLARQLIELGAGPGRLVGVCLERSVELPVALFGVLKTGAAYVPLDPSYPPERQAFMLADAGAGLLVTEERLLGTIGPGGTTVICVDRERDRERIAHRDREAVGVRVDPEQLAYVIYTSGSTDRPKGVAVTHRSVANLLAHMREAPGCGERDVVANVTTPAFDLSVPDWYLPLSTGGRLVIVPREATLDGVALSGLLARSGATLVQATPTTWQLLVDAGWSGSPELKIVCGGEPLSRALANALCARGRLWHMYGPTETTVWSSIMAVNAGSGPVSLGGPIQNTSFFVLDTTGQPVPVGVPGELHIGGDGLAAGYRERPDLTREKFIPNPVADHVATVYRTGDLVRWREPGTLEYLGRIDQQVKLRGHRIELEEIQAVLESDPTVGTAAVIVREDTSGDGRLVAYVTHRARHRVDSERVRRVCKQRLPPYMVRSSIVVLERFPVTANGKLDRGKLPAPEGSRPALSQPYAAPRTPIELALAEIWTQVLGLDRVGTHDDFFDLGGHSLLAMKMLARVQDALAVDIALNQVFDQPTVHQLAEAIGLELLDDLSDEDLAGLLADQSDRALAERGSAQRRASA